MGTAAGLICPVSTTNTNETYPDLSGHPADSSTPPELTRTCPYSSRDCYRSSIFKSVNTVSLDHTESATFHVTVVMCI